MSFFIAGRADVPTDNSIQPSARRSIRIIRTASVSRKTSLRSRRLDVFALHSQTFHRNVDSMKRG